MRRGIVVTKALLCGAAAAALLTPTAAPAAPATAPAWVVTPGVDRCQTELELGGASGAVAPVALVSDGETVQLVFSKADAPERAFLPIRIDHKPYANLVLRQADGKTTAIQLSAETLAALRKGGALQISWLADEPVQTSLAGSEQGLADLHTCGKQVAERFREQQAAERETSERTAAEARAKALADEQMAVAKAQKDAADAEAQRSALEAERLRSQAEAERQQAQAQAAAETARQREEADAEAYPYARVHEDQSYGYPQGSYAPQQPAYPQPYAPPPYRGW
jgi:hypothetical protein